MAANSMTVTLPESLKTFVEGEVAKGGFDSASDYVEQVLRERQLQEARGKLDNLLLEGLNSGEPVEVNDAFWAERDRKIEERSRKKAKS